MIEQEPKNYLYTGVDIAPVAPGKINLDVLQQTEIWRSIEGRTFRIESMPTSYLRNLLGYLERNSPAWADRRNFGLYDSGYDLEFNDFVDYDWVERTPLYKAIKKVLKTREVNYYDFS